MHGSVSCLSHTSSASAIKVEFVRVFCILSVPLALPSWTYLSVLIRNNAWPVCKYEIHKITRTFCRPGSVKLKCECSNLVPGVQASPVSVCQLLSRDNCNNCNIRRAQGGGGHREHAWEGLLPISWWGGQLSIICPSRNTELQELQKLLAQCPDVICIFCMTCWWESEFRIEIEVALPLLRDLILEKEIYEGGEEVRVQVTLSTDSRPWLITQSLSWPYP